MMRYSMKVFLPLPPGGMGPEYTCLSVCRHMASEELGVQVIVPLLRRRLDTGFITSATPRVMALLPYGVIRGFAVRRAERRFQEELRPGDVAYLWSEVSLDTARSLKARGVRVVREKTNCHKATAKQIYDDAYDRLNVAPMHGITEDWIAKENEELEMADFVISASPMVTESLLVNGVPSEKIIESSYGWDPGRVGGVHHQNMHPDGVTVLFVGWLSVTKGTHLLLQAWAKAKIRGRLVLAGRVEPIIAARFAHLLDREDVVKAGYVEDVTPLYRSADIFAFPSLAEGGPLVTYEAMANGLPVIASPMGAGRGVRHNWEGEIIDPYDVDGWVDALQRLASSPDLRTAYGQAARARSQQFTWESVGKQRRGAILERLHPANLHTR